jgi:hypothetical protein
MPYPRTHHTAPHPIPSYLVPLHNISPLFILSHPSSSHPIVDSKGELTDAPQYRPALSVKESEKLLESLDDMTDAEVAAVLSKLKAAVSERIKSKIPPLLTFLLFFVYFLHSFFLSFLSYISVFFFSHFYLSFTLLLIAVSVAQHNSETYATLY